MYVQVEDGNLEKATLTFLKLMLEAGEKAHTTEEPPVTRSIRLEESAEYLEDEAAIRK